MRRGLDGISSCNIWSEADGTAHLMGTVRMGSRRGLPQLGHRNLWVCDGSVFPTSGGVNPSLTIQALACRTADRIRDLAARGEL